LSDLPKRSSLADGLEALSPPASQTDSSPTATGQPPNSHPWTLLPASASIGLIAARQTEPTPHCMTVLAWLPTQESQVLPTSDMESLFSAAWREANAGLIAPLEAEPRLLSDSLSRSWWVLSGGPWAPLEILLQTWPNPPESVLADWESQRADWESLAARFPASDSNRFKQDQLRNRTKGIVMENPKKWWVDQQGVLLPFEDLWVLLLQVANSLQSTSHSADRAEESRLIATHTPRATADRSELDLRTAPKKQSTPATFPGKRQSKTKGDGLSLPTSRRSSGNRKRTAILWVGVIALGLLGLSIPRLLQSQRSSATTPRTDGNGKLTERLGATEIQPASPSTADPAQAVAKDPPDPLDLRGLSPIAEAFSPHSELELSSPNLFPDGDLKTKLDRLLGGSPGELLANTPTAEIASEESTTQADSPLEIRDPDSTDQKSPGADSLGVAPDTDRQSVSLEDRSFPLENLPLKSKWILRDRGLDPLLSLILDLDDLEGWQWNRMPIPLEAGKVVRAWGSHKDHPEAGGMVIQASLRTGRVWQVEIDVGWSPDPDTPPVRLSIGQADQWLGEVQSGLRWHDQALQQLRQTRNLTSNSSQRSLMLDQIRSLEGQQRTLKDLESRWQKVATLSQVFYGQQMLHIRWQNGSTDAASPTKLPESP
jgi:hypothetical protein